MTTVIPHTFGTPDWLNKEFLEDALERGLKRKNLKIRTYSLQPATNVGDNFLSRLYRGVIQFSSDQSSEEALAVIIKCPPKGEHVESYMDVMKFFPKEAKVLADTLPLMSKIIDNARLPKLFADLYYQQDGSNTVMIMEDLCADGFKAADRIVGLDIPHCVLVLESLATFHATSLAAIEQDPSIKERHSLLYWHKNNEVYFKAFISAGMIFMSEWPDLSKSLSEKLAKCHETALDKMFLGADRNDDDFNVLTHGDAWTNNFLFKYENGQPTEIKLVDFQNTCYNSPAVDLIYFIVSSPQDALKIENVDFFLETYHNKLVKVCDTLKYKITFSLEELKKTFIRRLAYGILVGITVYPFTTATPTKAVELEDFLADGHETPSVEPLKPEKYHNGMKRILEYFDKMGVFD